MLIKLRSNIGELISESGLQKKFIAGKLKVSVAQLRNYETGHSLIPFDKAYVLEDLLKSRLDCSITDFYERIDQDDQASENNISG
ncbi:transcriptional regulator [Bacillus niameyensis]|uniref:transcriptional regulator n=1 Tax=Bacillus niameyensis TaxID=1522308 RepID=UPI000783CF22|nr:transcriptional regulator [Bacillus niameyensis]